MYQNLKIFLLSSQAPSYSLTYHEIFLILRSQSQINIIFESGLFLSEMNTYSWERSKLNLYLLHPTVSTLNHNHDQIVVSHLLAMLWKSVSFYLWLQPFYIPPPPLHMRYFFHQEQSKQDMDKWSIHHVEEKRARNIITESFALF